VKWKRGEKGGEKRVSENKKGHVLHDGIDVGSEYINSNRQLSCWWCFSEEKNSNIFLKNSNSKMFFFPFFSY